MTPQEFLDKWRHVELKERSASQSHFNDLCALLGVVDPISADPKGECFTFEKGVGKTGGGEGWADVWKRGCFAWEYKGPKKDLNAALRQLLHYNAGLEHPPLLIVSDMDRILIHTNWTNTVQEVHEFATEDLLDGSVRDRLKAAFTDPEQFRPQKTRQTLTEETAAEFAGLAQRLRDRGHEAHEVAHFVNRLVFCMFAEDVGLLPDFLFTKMLRASQARPERFEVNARKLFAAMAEGGDIDFTPIEWFNGGLFDSDHALPVTSEDIGQLLQASGRDWSQIDPSILGTLFERGLDPAKRSQLGAHYTDRDKIMMIVRPTIIEPLEAEWAEALAKMTALVEKAPQATKDKLLRGAELARRTKALNEAEAIHSAFIERLANFRVLDPACGSGNFLYVALKALKDIEHRANLDAEALGLPRGFPRVGPENVLGIELSPYAAELARVSVWIGEIQWMRRNGFDAAKNPILRPLDSIECRDAVLNDDGTRAEWPAADVVIGNPPYVGDRYIIRELGAESAAALRAAYKGALPKSSNLVCYWFEKVAEAFENTPLMRAGLVTTSTIRNPNNRFILERLASVSALYNAKSNIVWVEGHAEKSKGAALRVAITCFAAPAVDDGRRTLDGMSVKCIHSDLSAGADDLTLALQLKQNTGVAFQGIIPWGKGFVIDGQTARNFLLAPINVNGFANSAVIHPYKIANDLTKRTLDRWLIDFGELEESEACLFEGPFGRLQETVHTQRAETGNEVAVANWWKLWNGRPALKEALAPLTRYIVTPRVSEHRFFVWLSVCEYPDSRLVAISRDDDTTFGILESDFHRLWTLSKVAKHGIGDSPTYNNKEIFETFPFPEGLTPDIPATDYANDPRAQKIAAAAARLNELRENWLNPADLVVRQPEVVPGYPDRILPKDEEAAKELKKRTLTNLYNARPQWLANAHAALDEAVAEAYGWGDDWRAGLLDDDEILARLFALNQQRAGSPRT